MITEIFVRPSPAVVTRLLAANGLPTADLAACNFEHFLGYGRREAPGGVVGLQIFDRIGLLRSLVVAPDQRGRGCGQALVAAIEHLAAGNGVHELYLLTDTAEAFFATLGYHRVDRADAPANIRATPEFSSLCPDDAALMQKALPAAAVADSR